MRSHPHKTHVKPATKKTPLIFLPAAFAFNIARSIFVFWLTLAITVLNIPISVVSRITGKSSNEIKSLEWVPIVGHRLKKSGKEVSYSQRIRTAASSALHLGSSAGHDAMRKELKAANERISLLEKAVAEAELNETALAGNLLVRELQHEVQPDLRDEYDVEQKLLHLLKQRITDNKLADEFKTNADAQSAYYNATIEQLRTDLMEELSIIEHQQQDKATLEKQIQVAKDVIERLKIELVKEEKKRDAELTVQKHKYKEQQDRVTSEFKTATDFCQDLRRKLNAETKHKEELLGKNQILGSELEQFKKRIEEQTTRLQELEIQKKEEAHQLALTEQERQRDIESNKTQITHLNQEIKITNDKIIIVRNKAAEDKAAALQKAKDDKERAISEYEKEMKHLKNEIEAEKKKAAVQHENQVKTIEQLKIKDSDDVHAERTKARHNIDHLKTEHQHEMQRIEAKHQKLREEVEAASAMLTLLKAEYEAEKNKAQVLSDEVQKAEDEQRLAQSDRAKLQARVEQFSKELELERNSISTKLEIEKSKLKESYEVEQRKVVSAHKEQTTQLTNELKEQKKATAESEKRLEEVKSELVSRITSLEKDRQESSRRVKEAEALAKLKENTLKETLKLQETSTQRASRLASLLSDEQKRTSQLQNRLEEEVRKTATVSQERLEYVRKLEAQVNQAKSMIETLKPQYESERAKNSKLMEEWREDKKKIDNQVESLEKQLETERETALVEKNKVVKFQTELRQLDNRNEALNRDVQNVVDGKEVVVKTEIHQTNVRVIETN